MRRTLGGRAAKRPSSARRLLGPCASARIELSRRPRDITPEHRRLNRHASAPRFLLHYERSNDRFPMTQVLYISQTGMNGAARPVAGARLSCAASRTEAGASKSSRKSRKARAATRSRPCKALSPRGDPLHPRIRSRIPTSQCEAQGANRRLVAGAANRPARTHPAIIHAAR